MRCARESTAPAVQGRVASTGQDGHIGDRTHGFNMTYRPTEQKTVNKESQGSSR